jgi:pimeloyl-ACP methyl ester carboxylesterase
VDSWLFGFVVVAGAGFGLWLLSHIIEALRQIPKTPAALHWAPEIPINYVDVGGTKLRYIKSGVGPVVVLLHTLRTQLDLFEKVVPELSKRFTVYALDYPGHGYSDIPYARYDAAFFTEAVEGFLDKLDLHEITLAMHSTVGSSGSPSQWSQMYSATLWGVAPVRCSTWMSTSRGDIPSRTLNTAAICVSEREAWMCGADIDPSPHRGAKPASANARRSLSMPLSIASRSSPPSYRDDSRSASS